MLVLSVLEQNKCVKETDRARLRVRLLARTVHVYVYIKLLLLYILYDCHGRRIGLVFVRASARRSLLKL